MQCRDGRKCHLQEHSKVRFPPAEGQMNIAILETNAQFKNHLDTELSMFDHFEVDRKMTRVGFEPLTSALPL